MTILKRRVGIEMEGYINNHPEGIIISGVDICEDGSLHNSEWGNRYRDRDRDDDDFWENEDLEERDLEDDYGVELKTEPINDLSILDEAWKDMQNFGWHIDEKAGTHVHVEINDFNQYEKTKLLRFGKGIERIMFMFVENYRNRNSYCEKIHKGWRKVFDPESRNFIVWDEFNLGNGLDRFLSNDLYSDNNAIWNGRYQWMNVLGSRFSTVEFRIFHAVSDIKDLKNQVQLAHAIVELVKHSSIEQLEFIIKELYRQRSVKSTVNKFFEALGLDFTMNTVGSDATILIKDKIQARKERRRARQAQAV
jgi:hypothetical protein